MADILIYLLYGKEKLREAKLGIDVVRRYSSHHLRNNPDVKLPIFHGIPLRPDDYDFSQDTSHFPGQEGSVSPPSFSKMPTFTREYDSGEYENYYLPERVICICSANTFSSGYTFTRYLYNAGATLVGTASAQEGKTGGVITDITLPNTGIKVAIPQTIGVVYLDRTDLGTMLHPHHELTYDRLVSYNFDENAGILYALEISKNQKNAKPKGV